MAPAGAKHGKIHLMIGSRVEQFATARDRGTVFGAETGFILARNPDDVLAPDMAFVRKDRLPPEGEPEGFCELVPDLVVEVVSPSERMTDILAKVMAYLDAGVRLLWLVEPRRRIVTVYGPDKRGRILGEGDALDGFRLAVADDFR